MSSVSLEIVVTAAIVGVVVGWLMTVVIKGWGFGLVGNIIVGVVGAVLVAVGLRYVGLYTFPFPDGLGNSVAPFAHAAFGAIVFLLVVGITRKRTA